MWAGVETHIAWGAVFDAFRKVGIHPQLAQVYEARDFSLR
jgi:hypothetical protein